MSEALQKLENIFSEETFTRKPLLNYTVKYFADLSTIINDINRWFYDYSFNLYYI